MSSTKAIATIDSKKPSTKQEIIAANIKLLIEQLEAGHSEALTSYLTAMSRFHKDLVDVFHKRAFDGRSNSLGF